MKTRLLEKIEPSLRNYALENEERFLEDARQIELWAAAGFVSGVPVLEKVVRPS